MELVQPIRSLKQIEAMKKYLRAGPNGLRNNLLFTLGINSGLRISDLLELKLKDIVDEKGKPVTRIKLRESKTKKAKDFPLGKTSQKAIAEYIAAIDNLDPEQQVFLSKKGGRITRVRAWQILSDAARAVGIKDSIGTHTLRKTFGYHAYKQGADITRIQALLNHSSPAVTLRYIGITQDELDNITINLNL